MLQNTHAKNISITSFKQPRASFKGKNIRERTLRAGDVGERRQATPALIGEFNAYNLLAVYGAAVCLGEESERILTALSLLSGAEGKV